MNTTIKIQIDNLEYPERNRVIDTIEQLDKGNGQSIEFYADGSGVCITLYHPTINHGCPGTVARSFDITTGILVLAGHRMKSHELPKCM